MKAVSHHRRIKVRLREPGLRVPDEQGTALYCSTKETQDGEWVYRDFHVIRRLTDGTLVDITPAGGEEGERAALEQKAAAVEAVAVELAGDGSQSQEVVPPPPAQPKVLTDPPEQGDKAMTRRRRGK